jgi:hypothetical protein
MIRRSKAIGWLLSLPVRRELGVASGREVTAETEGVETEEGKVLTILATLPQALLPLHHPPVVLAPHLHPNLIVERIKKAEDEGC